jgi:translation initiation factor IF-3
LRRPYFSRSRFSREPLHRRNGKIRAREVRVLDEEKRQLGVMSLNEALRLAMSKGLDLVEIAPNATPAVCRIVDYGKFMYEEAKRTKDSQSRQSSSKLKEIQLSPVIDPHDFSTKLSHAVGFLCEDMKVRVKLRFRGRQRAHTEFGFEVVNRFVKAVAPWGQADSPPKMLGERDLNVIISPLPRSKRAKNPRAAEQPEAVPAQEPTAPSA